MGFLNQNDDKPRTPSFYLEVTEQPKNIRPLKDKPQTVWGHTIPSVKTMGPDGKMVTIRRYSFVLCTSTGRNGAGCQTCNTQDPLWHMLDQKTRENRKGVRVDFPKKCIHILPVVETLSQQVKILKGGNGTYETMDAWHTAQPEGQKDLRRCDWSIHKTGKEMQTKYHVVRQDASAFTATDEQLREAQELMAKAIADMNPLPSAQFLEQIKGNLPDASVPSTFAVAVSTDNVTVTASPSSTPVTGLAGSGVQSVTPTVGTGTGVTASAKVTAPTIPLQVGQEAAPKDVLQVFTSWLNSQPEFQGAGMLTNLVPTLQTAIGDVNYYKCTPQQLETLKAALTAKLDAIRAKKA